MITLNSTCITINALDWVGVLAVAVMAIAILGFFGHDAMATSTTLSGSAACTSLGGIWKSTTTTCSVTNLAVNSGDALTISSGVTLEVLWNHGNGSFSITNYGTITNNAGATIILQTSSGADSPNLTAMFNAGTIRNSGTIRVHGYIANYGALTNDQGGNIINYDQAAITNASGGTITNYGTINDRIGNLQNSGGIIINGNSGTIKNSGYIKNFDGSITNFGNITNYQTNVYSFGTIETWAPSIITNYGTIVDFPGSDVINRGNLNNSGLINNYASYDSSTNSGGLANGGNITNQHQGIINNTGYIDNVGIINNIGTAKNYCGGIIHNGGTISGNPIINLCVTAPQPPTGLTATAISSLQINLSWTAPTNDGNSAITGYQIDRSIDGGTTWNTIVSNTGSTGTTYSNTGLASSTTYSYRVSATNSIGTSSPSNTASATTNSIPTAPSPPTGLKATAVSFSKINLSWTAPTNNGGSAITGYKIESSKDNGSTWSTIVSNTGTSTTSYSNSGLIQNTQYTYRVSAINSVGTSSPSNIATAATPAKLSLVVTSADPSGNKITGILVQIKSTSGTVLNSGYTPKTFYMSSGHTYIVYASNYQNQTLNHWDDGTTNPNRTITPTTNSTLIAYYGTSYMQDTTHSSGLSTYSGRQIQAEYVNSSSVLVGKQIDTISIELKRVGSPTGNATIGVFNGDLSVKKSFANVTVSTLTTSYKNYTFSSPSSVPPYQIQAGDRIGIKFAGGNSTFYVATMTDQNSADPFDGTNSYLTYYTTLWKSFTSNDLYMTLQRLH